MKSFSYFVIVIIVVVGYGLIGGLDIEERDFSYCSNIELLMLIFL